MIRGIEEDFAPVKTLQLYGTAERFNKTLEVNDRAMMIDSGLPSNE